MSPPASLAKTAGQGVRGGPLRLAERHPRQGHWLNESLSEAKELERLHGHEMRVKSDWSQVEALLLYESAPPGGSAGPNAARLIGTAVVAPPMAITLWGGSR